MRRDNIVGSDLTIPVLDNNFIAFREQATTIDKQCKTSSTVTGWASITLEASHGRQGLELED